MLRRCALPAVLSVLACCAVPDSTLRVTPETGTQAGGQVLRIEGSDFMGHGALVVYLGGRAAKGVVIESPTLVRVTTPESETIGAVDVVLRFGDGTEQTLEQGFAFDEQPGFVISPRIGGGGTPSAGS